MGRSLKYEIPGVDPRVALDEWAEKGWRGVFGRRADGERPSRVLEIGFGRGEFLLDLATRSPDVECSCWSMWCSRASTTHPRS